MSTKKVCVILAGCGVFDGAEIYESVFTLLALEKAGAIVTCVAPDVAQMHVINHATGEVAAGETRNVFVESARVARGNITPIADVKGSDFDAIIMPGGFGVAKNLSTFATQGAECSIHPEVERVLKEAYSAKKVLGAICIAPAVVARVFGDNNVKLTIGSDSATAEQISRTGANHIEARVTDVVVDNEHRIVTTPAYMLGQRMSEVKSGIDKLVQNVLELA
ncbi:ThiJ/PfpI domain-containing protein [Desulfurispirillum indicum S5]|uniref:ThiJ/PfpI domain-containing protein n=1 Tax=Desulfurispirillum indicum (strain ATCC BAA-1389 / DSM 22839 / S5) TaxID=653733 RepID=E6W5G2_DESIS|nr:isoprenoid biosynthesis glyoxalase ElbB [Desulfurispirillum indicum]ADU64893.1 ThiJ/PfpI domain-containing protein [Desulfurispirillum indicum S5]